MNIQSSNGFYQELMTSEHFTAAQKKYIKKLYDKHNNAIKKKISISLKFGYNTGRPTKIKNKDHFKEMAAYYKQGLIGCQTCCRMFNIGRSTFFKNCRELIKEEQTIEVPYDEKHMQMLEDIFNKYCYDYADNWVSKLHTYQYKEDMRQDCLLKLWGGGYQLLSTSRR